jgi:hypothetical protein
VIRRCSNTKAPIRAKQTGLGVTVMIRMTAAAITALLSVSAAQAQTDHI